MGMKGMDTEMRETGAGVIDVLPCGDISDKDMNEMEVEKKRKRKS
jgi:hypothetical protein